MSAEGTYSEILEVFDENDENKKYGTLTLYERSFPNSSSTECFWEWKNGPEGSDQGDCRWSPRVVVLFSTRTAPSIFVWAIVNRRWGPASLSRKQRPWFLDDDKIIVTNEERPPYPAHKARRRK